MLNIEQAELDELQVKLAQLAALPDADSPKERERENLIYELLLGYWRIINVLIDELS
jgi:hypothetical protein